MAAVTLLGTATFNTTAGNKTVTATPAVGDLIVVIAATSGLAGGTTSVTDNASGTYTLVDQDRTGFSTTGVLNVYVRDSLISSASSTVFTANQSGSTGGGLVVLKVTGMAKTGSSAVRSNGGQSSGTAATTPAPVLSNTPQSGNPIITAVACGTNSTAFVTARTSYTERFENGYSTPTTGLHVSTRDTGETSATLTYGSTVATAFASVGIELDTSLDVNKSESVTVSDGGPVLVDSYSESNATNDTNLGVVNKRIGQSFTATAGVLDSVKFYLKDTGSATGNATATIYAHSGTFGTSSVGTGAVLATSDNFDVSTLTGTYALTTFNFSGSNRITLTAATNYVVMLEYSAASNIVIGTDITAPTHAGNFVYYDTGWNADNIGDTSFYIYTAATSPIVEVTTPGGGGGDLSINKSESVTVSESRTVFKDTEAINKSDSVTVTESLQRLTENYINKSDTTTLTESTKQEVTSFIVETETATVTESLQREANNRVSVSDTSTITESVQREVTGSIIETESITVTDTPTVAIEVIGDRDVNVSDTATITESRTVLIPELLVNKTDSITVTENRTALIPELFINKSELSTVTESLGAYITALFIQESENVSLTENTIVNTGNQAFYNVITSDTATVSEQVSVKESDVLQSVADTATVSESVSVSVQPTITPTVAVNDNSTVSESVTVQPPTVTIQKTENVTVTESATAQIPTTTWSINVSDSISGTATTARKYYIDSNGNVYWVINQATGLVEKI